jgi:hypothetical protein
MSTPFSGKASYAIETYERLEHTQASSLNKRAVEKQETRGTVPLFSTVEEEDGGDGSQRAISELRAQQIELEKQLSKQQELIERLESGSLRMNYHD